MRVVASHHARVRLNNSLGTESWVSATRCGKKIRDPDAKSASYGDIASRLAREMSWIVTRENISYPPPF